MSPRARIAIVAVAAVALVIAFFGARSSEEQDDPPAGTTATTQATSAPSATTQTEAEAEEPTATTEAPAIETIRIEDGKPVGGVAELEFGKGDRVRFRVRSDAAGHVHVHGYDILRDLKPGGQITFDFEADIDGRFEVELEDTQTQIARLDVTP